MTEIKKIVIVGAGGHAKVVADSIEKQNEYEIVGFIDSNKKGERIYKDFCVLGTDDEAGNLYEHGVHYACMGIGFIGNTEIRKKIYQKYKDIGFEFPIIIDSSAIVANGVSIGEGTYVGKRAVINSYAEVGKLCIINTASVIEHECNIGDYTHISVGTVICGQCQIGSETMIGANATVIQNRNVGNQVVIGAGSVVIRNVENNLRVAGCPAKEIGEGL